MRGTSRCDGDALLTHAAEIFMRSTCIESDCVEEIVGHGPPYLSRRASAVILALSLRALSCSA